MPMMPVGYEAKKYAQTIVDIITESTGANIIIPVADVYLKLDGQPLRYLPYEMVDSILRNVSSIYSILGKDCFAVAYNSTTKEFVAISFDTLRAAIPKEKTE